MLAIGDGANDVAMIQAAEVGVGIAGKEGRQAANNADYIIGQFRFLARLLLVHGHVSHLRLARLIKYFFYKNGVFAAVLFFFQPFCGWSGQAIIDGISAATYNVLFSSFAIFFLSLMERPCRDLHMLTAHPRTYRSSRSLTTAIFWKTAVLHVRRCHRRRSYWCSCCCTCALILCAMCAVARAQPAAAASRCLEVLRANCH